MIASPQATFEQREYLELIVSRGAAIRRLVGELKSATQVSTALDAGCGIGFFSQILRDCGLEVRAFDGRTDNIEEARRRYPDISFELGDAQDPGIVRLGKSDLVLCFGLLYHLENPMLAIRNLHELTAKFMLLESICFPDDRPWMLLREEYSDASQSLTDLAFYPSEGCLVKMCYRAGFSRVFRAVALPDHDQFRDTIQFRRRRTLLLAVKGRFNPPGFERFEEPVQEPDPWKKRPAKFRQLGHRARRFFSKSFREQYAVVAARLRSGVGAISLPVRLPFGAWWIRKNDNVGQPLRAGTFEKEELEFVGRFLQPDMTVLDIGAHHGLYTLLASKRVGPSGHVFSFEPSPRERRALRLHLALNLCRNVTVQGVALGSEESEATLHVVQGGQTGCNSLRQPEVVSSTAPIPVRVTSLDAWLKLNNITTVDFIKLDVEGGELEVLKGAVRMLENRPRPVILAEVQDVRTAPWGYRAKQILLHLRDAGYHWLKLLPDGSFIDLDLTPEEFDGNFVACPCESISALQTLSLPRP